MHVFVHVFDKQKRRVINAARDVLCSYNSMCSRANEFEAMILCTFTLYTMRKIDQLKQSIVGTKHGKPPIVEHSGTNPKQTHFTSVDTHRGISRHMFGLWTSILIFYLAFYLAFYLTYISTCYLAFYLTSILTFYLTYTCILEKHKSMLIGMISTF